MTNPVASEGKQPRRRWRALREAVGRAAEEAARDLPPNAREAAVATMAGAPFLAIANAIDIVINVHLPARGLGLRAAHHFFDVLEALSAAVWAALPFALVAVLPIPRKYRWSGWVLVAGAAALAMWVLLDNQLERQAHSAFDDVLWWAILPVYVLLCGLAVPAGYFVANYGTRFRHGWIAVLALGAGGIAFGHFFMRDDYPAVHVAVSWVSMCIAGGALAPRILHWLDRSRQRLAAAACGALVLALAGLLWVPSNTVRMELFRQPGAVAPWLFAQVSWSPPPVSAIAAPPRAEPLPSEVLEHALIGVPDAPVVVLLTVDALRGEVVRDPKKEPRLPEITRLKESGAYFPHATSPGAQTSVSLTTLFANRYFSQMRWSMQGKGKTRFLYAAGDPTPRFPELLADAGVATHSFVPIIFLSKPFGIARGFTEETLTVDDRRHAMAAAVMNPLLQALEKLDNRPTFFFVHLMEPHEPYDRGKVKEGKAFQRYLSEVEVVDGWVGRLVKAMRKRFPNRGYIIFSADHGEAFGEHDTWFHTKTLYDELLSVPLIVWGPTIERRVIDARVGLIDVAPTILHLFRRPIPPSFIGRSLLPLIRGDVTELPRPLIAEGRLRRAMYTPDNLKVIEDTVRKTVEVYDLTVDPGELNNIFDEDPARAEPPVAELRAFFAEDTLIKEGYEPPFKP